MEKGISGFFEITIPLPIGTYWYKFIVDGKWFYDILLPNQHDLNGNVNNIFVVEKKNFYISTAIFYTNGPPHFGHAYEVIAADTIARYNRILGEKEVFFMTGTDEHGQKVALKAAEEGTTPIELCNKYVKLFQELNKKLNISEDYYIRTTYPKHQKCSQWLWEKAWNAGDIYLSNYEGWYNLREEKFVPEAEAVKSEYKDPGSGNPLTLTKEASYFFRMSKYQDALVRHIHEHPEFIIPQQRRNEILERLKEPLQDLSISRTTFDWGVPVPKEFSEKTDEKHVMYVWFDALTNYLSGVDYPNGENAKFWPADVHLIGKDISWFHSVIWPCMLMSAGVPLPKTILCHGFVNGPDGRKMSKSYGNVVIPDDVLETYSSDIVRYFVLREGVFGADFSFSENALRERYDAELADDLGNLVSRSLSLAAQHNNSEVPSEPYTEIFSVEELKNKTREAYQTYQIQQAIEVALDQVRLANKWIATEAPWKNKGTSPEESRKRLNDVRTMLESIYILGHFFYPVMPEKIVKIYDSLGTPMTTLKQLRGWGNLKPHTKVGAPEILFPRFRASRFDKKQEEAAVETSEPSSVKATSEKGPAPKGTNTKEETGGKQTGGKQTGGKQTGGKQTGGKQTGGGGKGGGGKQNVTVKPKDISRLNLRVGKIITCQHHPEADRLYVEEIDIGEEKPRTVVSGLAEHLTLEEMIGKHVVVVANLKPTAFRGIKSFAMVIAGTNSEGTKLVEPPKDAKLGERVTFEGYPDDQDDPELNPKQKIFEDLKPDLATNAEGIATYKGIRFMTSKGPCTCVLKNAKLG